MREIWLPMCHRPAIWQVGHTQTARGHTPPAFPVTAPRYGRSRASRSVSSGHLSVDVPVFPSFLAEAVPLRVPIVFLSIHTVSYLYFRTNPQFVQYLFFKHGLVMSYLSPLVLLPSRALVLAFARMCLPKWTGRVLPWPSILFSLPLSWFAG